MTIKIDKNVPSPVDGSTSELGMAARLMEIGDSIFLRQPIANISSRFSTFGVKLDKKFVCRGVTEDGVSGVRVWRIA